MSFHCYSLEIFTFTSCVCIPHGTQLDELPPVMNCIRGRFHLPIGIVLKVQKICSSHLLTRLAMFVYPRPEWPVQPFKTGAGKPSVFSAPGLFRSGFHDFLCARHLGRFHAIFRILIWQIQENKRVFQYKESFSLLKLSLFHFGLLLFALE